MASKKFYENLLVVVGMFLIFFVITMISVSLVVNVCGVDTTTRDGMLFISIYQAVVMFIAPSIMAALIINRRPFSFLTLTTSPTFLAIIGVIFAYLIALPALNQLIFWNSNITFPDSLAYWGEVFRELEENATAASGRMLDTASLGGMFVNLAVIALLTAFGEELFFRGTLQNASGASGAHHTAIWVVALVFSAMHFQVFGFVPRLLLGAWFGYLFFWTRSIYVPITAHFINNGVVVVCTWLSRKGNEFDFDRFGVTEYGFPVAAFISALAFIVFVVFFKDFFFHPREKKQSDPEYA